MARQDRRWEIRRRRNRRKKLAKLRARFSAARTAAEREKILAKVQRVSPTVTREQFIASVEALGGGTRPPARKQPGGRSGSSTSAGAA
ncbi:MAG: hypothetical protein N3C12_15070 [Candidatus Binatia bacterium]|nr:hypothetical protein [Candidatus Binatia bacterium]